jgi:hypothetical protein
MQTARKFEYTPEPKFWYPKLAGGVWASLSEIDYIKQQMREQSLLIRETPEWKVTAKLAEIQQRKAGI